MSNTIQSLSKDAKALTKLTHHRTKSSISTLDNSIKIQAISQMYELDSLYQEYDKMKEKRQKSQQFSSEIQSKVNYLQKEQQALYNKFQQMINYKLKQEKSHCYSLDAKARHELIHNQQEDYLEKQKKKTIEIKSSTDYIMRTWKDQIRVRNENKANKMRSVKFRNEAMKSLSKIKESNSKQERCAKIKKQRAVSAEKREQHFQKIKDEQKKDLIKKIIREQEIKKEYDSLISTYREKGEKLLSQMENIPAGINQTLFLAHKFTNLPLNNDESDWILRDLEENEMNNN